MDVISLRRVSPLCPRCKKHNTYDIIPEIPNSPELQMDESLLIGKFSEGNAKYQCIDCGHIWKKYRGRGAYKRINAIFAETGGSAGTGFFVKADLNSMIVERKAVLELFQENLELHQNLELARILIPEELDWLRAELYTCDFVNWAERYIGPAGKHDIHWSVRIEYDTHHEIKTGSNHFPLKWKKFCKTMAAVSDEAFY